MAMTDYPYPANFLEPMPGYPINAAVQPFVDIDTQSEYYAKHPEELYQSNDGGFTDRESSLMEALAESTGVYFNYTGNYPCTNLTDWEGTGSLDGFGWNILACN